MSFLSTEKRLETLYSTANIYGPFIDAGRITATPTKSFLEGLSDPILNSLQIPRYLIWSFGIKPAPANEQLDPWIFYLSIAMTRHFSYHKAFAMRYMYKTFIFHDTNTTLLEKYHAFREAFRKAGKVILKAGGALQVDEWEFLVKIERDLTHETFRAFPELFHRSIVANIVLLEKLNRFVRKACKPSHRMGSLAVVRLRLEKVLRLSETDWIRLEDADDILDGNSQLYATWMKTQKERNALMEYCWRKQEELTNGYASADGRFLIRIDTNERQAAPEEMGMGDGFDDRGVFVDGQYRIVMSEIVNEAIPKMRIGRREERA